MGNHNNPGKAGREARADSDRQERLRQREFELWLSKQEWFDDASLDSMIYTDQWTMKQRLYKAWTSGMQLGLQKGFHSGNSQPQRS